MNEFKEGDRVKRTHYRTDTFVFIGWSPRGRAQLRNERSGTLLEGWWRSVADMPKWYEAVE